MWGLDFKVVETNVVETNDFQPFWQAFALKKLVSVVSGSKGKYSAVLFRRPGQ